MEKQYSTHYLTEKYKQHQFVDIYNFEITVSKTQSTPQRQNRRVTEMFDFFLPEHLVSATELAQQNDPDPRFTEKQWKNRCRKFFVSYLQVNLCRGLDSLDWDQIPSQLCLIKICHYKKGMCFTFDFGWYSIHFDIVR